MAVVTESIEAIHESYEWQTSNNRLGLWLFFLSESFIFGGLLVARFFLWGGTRPDLNQTFPFFITGVLLLSSFFMNRAESAIAYDDRKTFLRSLLITAFLGTIFLLGVILFEWGFSVEEGNLVLGNHIKPTDGVYGAVLYGMTGLHALHVLSGVIVILIVWNLGRKGHYSREKHWGVEATAIYWHYVDLVWVFFYPALYLIGTAVAVGHG
ncbi:MAG: cytochrome c oxidase subunit 3 [Chloroflexota bacterium]|nr:cytochrome c oxidase subunit 3 [Chloroflexota bacterium]